MELAQTLIHSWWHVFRGERAGHTRAQLKKEEVLAAIDSTDYCDFLVDLVQAEL